MDARGADADELARLIEDDPAELARFRAAYRGRHDALDALGWRRSGLPASPEESARLDRLRRAAFSRDPEPGAAERLAPLERAVAEDAVALDDALALLAADRARRAQAVADGDRAASAEAASGGTEGGGADNDGADSDDDALAAATLPRRRRRILLLSGAVVLLLLAVGGMVVPSLTPQRSIDVFDRAETEADRGIDDVLSIELGPLKVRYLDQLEGWDLYAIRFVAQGDGAAQICLLSERDDVRTGGCVDEDTFEQEGVVIETDTIVDRSGGSRELAPVTFTWGPEGGPRAEVGDAAGADSAS